MHPGSIAFWGGGSSKTTVAQKCSGSMESHFTELRADLWTDLRTDGLTWIGARDTCVSKNNANAQTCKYQKHKNDEVGMGIDIKARNDMDFRIKIGDNWAK